MATGAATKIKKKKKSVLKRNRQTVRRTEFNRSNRTEVRSMMKRVRTAISGGDSAGAEKLLSPTMSAIDQALRKGVLKENTANRYKSRISLAYNAMKAKA